MNNNIGIIGLSTLIQLAGLRFGNFGMIYRGCCHSQCIPQLRARVGALALGALFLTN